MKLPDIPVKKVCNGPVLILTAIIINILVFLLIQQLVTNKKGVAPVFESVNLVDFIRLQQKPETPKPDQDKKELEQPEPEKEPPPPEIPQPQFDQPQTRQLDLPIPDVNIPLSLSGTPYLGEFRQSTVNPAPVKPSKPAFDPNVVPTLGVPPVYPPRALRRGIEGVVTVEFTITTSGTVKDVEIVKAKPPDIFDKAVLNAISKWKFNPNIVDGKPIEKRARQNVKFKLER